MKLIFAVFLFWISWVLCCWASPAQAKTADVQDSRSPFSLTPFVGERWDRLLNTDGSFAGYSGLEYGANFGLQLFDLGEGRGLDVFAQYNYSDTKGSTGATSDFTREERIFGFDMYYSSWGGVALGYGTANNSVTTNGATGSSSHDFLAAGLIFDFIQMGDFTLSLQGWYKNGYISKQNNSDLVQNSGFDSTEVLIGLRWSPMTTQIKFQGK